MAPDDKKISQPAGAADADANQAADSSNPAPVTAPLNTATLPPQSPSKRASNNDTTRKPNSGKSKTTAAAVTSPRKSRGKSPLASPRKSPLGSSKKNLRASPKKSAEPKKPPTPTTQDEGAAANPSQAGTSVTADKTTADGEARPVSLSDQADAGQRQKAGTPNQGPTKPVRNRQPVEGITPAQARKMAAEKARQAMIDERNRKEAIRQEKIRVERERKERLEREKREREEAERKAREEAERIERERIRAREERLAWAQSISKQVVNQTSAVEVPEGGFKTLSVDQQSTASPATGSFLAATKKKKEMDEARRLEEEREKAHMETMNPQEKLRYLLKKATSKEDAQRIAREFLLQQKASEERKKQAEDPAAKAEAMMKRLRMAHQQAMLEEQNVLLEEQRKREDQERLKRGLPQRWGTIKDPSAPSASTSQQDGNMQDSQLTINQKPIGRTSIVDVEAWRAKEKKKAAAAAGNGLLEKINERRTGLDRQKSTMSRKSVSFNDQPAILEDSDDEMLTGQGQVEVGGPREDEDNKKSVKEVTQYKLQDPALYNRNNLVVKTNKSVFKKSEPADTRYITSPEAGYKRRGNGKYYWGWLRTKKTWTKVVALSAFSALFTKVKRPRKESKIAADKKKAEEKKKAEQTKPTAQPGKSDNGQGRQQKQQQQQEEEKKEQEAEKLEAIEEPKEEEKKPEPEPPAPPVELKLQTYDDVSDSDDEKNKDKKAVKSAKSAEPAKSAIPTQQAADNTDKNKKKKKKKKNPEDSAKEDTKADKSAAGSQDKADISASAKQLQENTTPSASRQQSLQNAKHIDEPQENKPEIKKKKKKKRLKKPSDEYDYEDLEEDEETTTNQQPLPTVVEAESKQQQNADKRQSQQPGKADSERKISDSSNQEISKTQPKQKQQTQVPSKPKTPTAGNKSDASTQLKRSTTNVKATPASTSATTKNGTPTAVKSATQNPNVKTVKAQSAVSIPAAVPSTPEPNNKKKKTTSANKKKAGTSQEPTQKSEQAKTPAATTVTGKDNVKDSKIDVSKPVTSEQKVTSEGTKTDKTSEIKPAQINVKPVSGETTAEKPTQETETKRDETSVAAIAADAAKGEGEKEQIDKPKKKKKKKKKKPSDQEVAADLDTKADESSPSSTDPKPKAEGQGEKEAAAGESKQSADRNPTDKEPAVKNTGQVTVGDVSKPSAEISKPTAAVTSKEPDKTLPKKENPKTNVVPKKTSQQQQQPKQQAISKADQTMPQGKTVKDLLDKGRNLKVFPTTTVARGSTQDAIDAVKKVNRAQSRPLYDSEDSDADGDDELPAHLKMLSSAPADEHPVQKKTFSIFDVFNLKRHLPKRKGPPPPLTPEIDDNISIDSVPLNEPTSPTYSRPPTPPTPDPSIASGRADTPDYPRPETPPPSVPSLRDVCSPDYPRVDTPPPSIGEPVPLTPDGSPPPTPPPSVAEARFETPCYTPPPTPEPSIAEARFETPCYTPPPTPEPSIAEARFETPCYTPPSSPAPSIGNPYPQTPYGLPPIAEEQRLKSATESVPTVVRMGDKVETAGPSGADASAAPGISKQAEINQKIPGGAAAAKTMMIKRNGKMSTIDIIKLRRMLKDLSSEDVRDLHVKSPKTRGRVKKKIRPLDEITDIGSVVSADGGQQKVPAVSGLSEDATADDQSARLAAHTADLEDQRNSSNHGNGSTNSNSSDEDSDSQTGDSSSASDCSEGSDDSTSSSDSADSADSADSSDDSSTESSPSKQSMLQQPIPHPPLYPRPSSAASIGSISNDSRQLEVVIQVECLPDDKDTSTNVNVPPDACNVIAVASADNSENSTLPAAVDNCVTDSDCSSADSSSVTSTTVTRAVHRQDVPNSLVGEDDESLASTASKPSSSSASSDSDSQSSDSSDSDSESEGSSSDTSTQSGGTSCSSEGWDSVSQQANRSVLAPTQTNYTYPMAAGVGATWRDRQRMQSRASELTMKEKTQQLMGDTLNEKNPFADFIDLKSLESSRETTPAPGSPVKKPTGATDSKKAAASKVTPAGNKKTTSAKGDKNLPAKEKESNEPAEDAHSIASLSRENTTTNINAAFFPKGRVDTPDSEAPTPVAPTPEPIKSPVKKVPAWQKTPFVPLKPSDKAKMEKEAAEKAKAEAEAAAAAAAAAAAEEEAKKKGKKPKMTKSISFLDDNVPSTFKDFDADDSDDEREKKKQKEREAAKAKKDAYRKAHLNMLKNIEAFPGKPINKNPTSKIKEEIKKKSEPTIKPIAEESKPAEQVKTIDPPAEEETIPQESAEQVQVTPEKPKKKLKVKKALKKLGAKGSDGVDFETLFGKDSDDELPAVDEEASDEIKEKKKKKKKKKKRKKTEDESVNKDAEGQQADETKMEKATDENKNSSQQPTDESKTDEQKSSDVKSNNEASTTGKLPSADGTPVKGSTASKSSESDKDGKSSSSPIKASTEPVKSGESEVKPADQSSKEEEGRPAISSETTEGSPSQQQEKAAGSKIGKSDKKADSSTKTNKNASQETEQSKRADDLSLVKALPADEKTDNKDLPAAADNVKQTTSPSKAAQNKTKLDKTKTTPSKAAAAGLAVKTDKDPFLYKEGSEVDKAWKAAEKQQKEIPQPEPKPKPDIEFKQPEQEAQQEHDSDVISIPNAEGTTPKHKPQKGSPKKAADAVSIPGAEAKTPAKTVTPGKGKSLAKSSISVPKGEPVTPVHAKSTISVPNAEPGTTPKHQGSQGQAEDGNTSIPEGEVTTPQHQPTGKEKTGKGENKPTAAGGKKKNKKPIAAVTAADSDKPDWNPSIQKGKSDFYKHKSRTEEPSGTGKPVGKASVNDKKKNTGKQVKPATSETTENKPAIKQDQATPNEQKEIKSKYMAAADKRRPDDAVDSEGYKVIHFGYKSPGNSAGAGGKHHLSKESTTLTAGDSEDQPKKPMIFAALSKAQADSKPARGDEEKPNGPDSHITTAQPARPYAEADQPAEKPSFFKRIFNALSFGKKAQPQPTPQTKQLQQQSHDDAKKLVADPGPSNQVDDKAGTSQPVTEDKVAEANDAKDEMEAEAVEEADNNEMTVEGEEEAEKADDEVNKAEPKSNDNNKRATKRKPAQPAKPSPQLPKKKPLGGPSRETTNTSLKSTSSYSKIPSRYNRPSQRQSTNLSRESTRVSMKSSVSSKSKTPASTKKAPVTTARKKQPAVKNNADDDNGEIEAIAAAQSPIKEEEEPTESTNDGTQAAGDNDTEVEGDDFHTGMSNNEKGMDDKQEVSEGKEEDEDQEEWEDKAVNEPTDEAAGNTEDSEITELNLSKTPIDPHTSVKSAKAKSPASSAKSKKSQMIEVDEERPENPSPSLISKAVEPSAAVEETTVVDASVIVCDEGSKDRPYSNSRFPPIESASREGSSKSVRSTTSSVSPLPPVHSQSMAEEDRPTSAEKAEEPTERSPSLPSIHSDDSGYSGINNGQRSPKYSAGGRPEPDKSSHEIQQRAKNSYDFRKPKPKLSTNDDIMARFLEQAKKELEDELGREQKRKDKMKTSPRKAKTPQQTPRPAVSNRVEDYPVYRLAPHKHIYGGGGAAHMLPFQAAIPEPSKFEPINFKKAKALTRTGSLPKFEFKSLMEMPELLPVLPRKSPTSNPIVSQSLDEKKRVAWSDGVRLDNLQSSYEDPDDLTPRVEDPSQATPSPTPANAYSFPANSPRKNLNESVKEIQTSMDKSMKNIIRAFNESNRRKELARKNLQKTVHRRVNYAAPPSFNTKPHEY